MATGGGMTTGTDSRFAAYPVEILAAAADEAHRLGKIITTHAHGVPGIRNATQAGIDGIQHVTMMGDDWTWQFDEEAARMMVDRGTVACVTIGRRHPRPARGRRRHQQPQPEPGQSAAPRVARRTARLRKAGVNMVAATDVGVTLTDFGEELFFELEIYVRIGSRRSRRSAPRRRLGRVHGPPERDRPPRARTRGGHLRRRWPPRRDDHRPSQGRDRVRAGPADPGDPRARLPPWPTTGPLARFTMDRTPATT